MVSEKGKLSSDSPKELLEKYKFQLLTVLTLFILSVGTIFYHFVERLSVLDSVYFSVVMLTTVGFGDITPKTDIGKLFTIFYILIGVGIILAFVNATVQRAGSRRIISKKEKPGI